MCRLPNIEVMGLDPIHFLYNIELNKLVTQKLRIEIMSLSYYPKGVAPWSDRSCGPRWASSAASTPVCIKELHLHVKVKGK
jgi:hypothetical protein